MKKPRFYGKTLRIEFDNSFLHPPTLSSGYVGSEVEYLFFTYRNGKIEFGCEEFTVHTPVGTLKKLCLKHEPFHWRSYLSVLLYLQKYAKYLMILEKEKKR